MDLIEVVDDKTFGARQSIRAKCELAPVFDSV